MIRNLKLEDREEYINMCKSFYMLDVVEKDIPEENIINTFNELIRSDVYGQCLICEENGVIEGYFLIAKTFSQEAGGICWWLEEMYVKPEFRGKSISKKFFDHVFKNMPKDIKRLRLEVEADKEELVSLYISEGFDFMEYSQMKRDF